MNRTLKSIVATGVVALSLSAGSAHAIFINGSAGISDAGISFTNLPGSIVSALTSVTLGAAPISGCTGDISGACPGTAPGTTMTIPVSNGAMSATFTTGAFTWTFGTIVGTITRTAPSAVGPLVSDHFNFVALGTVTGGGFDPTQALLTFSSDGTCSGTVGACTPGTAAATWNGVLVATGQNTTPEPGVIALMGIGLAALGFVRRKKA